MLFGFVIQVLEPSPDDPRVYFYCLMLKEIMEEGAVKAIWEIPHDKSLERLAYRTYCPAEKGYLPPENLSATIPRLQPDDIEQCQKLQRRASVGAIGEAVIIEQYPRSSPPIPKLGKLFSKTEPHGKKQNESMKQTVPGSSLP